MGDWDRIFGPRDWPYLDIYLDILYIILYDVLFGGG